MPTHDSGTLFDHVYTHNVCQANVRTEVIDCYYSYHDIVACAIDVKLCGKLSHYLVYGYFLSLFQCLYVIHNYDRCHIHIIDNLS